MSRGSPKILLRHVRQLASPVDALARDGRAILERQRKRASAP